MVLIDIYIGVWVAIIIGCLFVALSDEQKENVKNTAIGIIVILLLICIISALTY
jgi:hypothetical protein